MREHYDTPHRKRADIVIALATYADFSPLQLAVAGPPRASGGFAMERQLDQEYEGV